MRNKDDLFQLHKDLCESALELMKKKNADYSKSHPLGNFFVCEAMQASSAENGIIVRLSDKLSRLVSVIEKGAQVKDETIDDTIVDVINYAVLLSGVIRYRKVKK